jgi:hypothetical protein
MSEPTNASRAESAERALRSHVEAKGEKFDLSSSEIVDLITDLLHLAARIDQGDDPIESALRRARMHFEAENEEETA